MYRKLEVWIKFFIRHGKHKRLRAREQVGIDPRSYD